MRRHRHTLPSTQLDPEESLYDIEELRAEILRLYDEMLENATDKDIVSMAYDMNILTDEE